MTHEERVYHHLYETLEGINEHAERIASLEELVLHLYACLTRPKTYDGTTCPYITLTDQGTSCNHETCGFKKRMAELEVVE